MSELDKRLKTTPLASIPFLFTSTTWVKLPSHPHIRISIIQEKRKKTAAFIISKFESPTYVWNNGQYGHLLDSAI